MVAESEDRRGSTRAQPMSSVSPYCNRSVLPDSAENKARSSAPRQSVAMTNGDVKPTQRVNNSSPFLKEAPHPSTELGVYRLLGPRAAVLVSPLQLGGMNFGDAWAAIAGYTTKDDIFNLLDAYVEAGGNWLDTFVTPALLF